MATVTEITTGQTSFGASTTLTCASGVALGTGIVIVGIFSASSGTPSATFPITDAGNTYNIDYLFFDTTGTSNRYVLLSTYVTHAISPGGTIVITPPNGSNEYHFWAAYNLSKFAATSALDVLAQAFPATYTNPIASPTTATTTHQPNLTLLLWWTNQTNTISSITNGTWNITDNGSAYEAGARYYFAAWSETTTIGTKQASATCTNSDQPCVLLASYKESYVGDFVMRTMMY